MSRTCKHCGNSESQERPFRHDCNVCRECAQKRATANYHEKKEERKNREVLRWKANPDDPIARVYRPHFKKRLKEIREHLEFIENENLEKMTAGQIDEIMANRCQIAAG